MYVRPGGECFLPGAGEDDDPYAIVVLELSERAPQAR